MANQLENLGYNNAWKSLFQAHASRGLEPARILAQHRGWWTCATTEKIFDAKPTGALWRSSPISHPAVGDWVVVHSRNARIQKVLPRQTAFVRQAAGKRTKLQVICTNVDTVLVVTSVDQDFNLRRLERYLTAVVQSGARPVVVLSKCDLIDEPHIPIAQVKSLGPTLEVIPTSVMSSDGLDALKDVMKPGETLVLVGSSGVGKSSLVNFLNGSEIQSTRDVRANDGRGRHTTTHRELFVMPSGALLIDTPGMREFTVWAEAREEDLSAFDDILAFAESCRFRNCKHEQEPDCAVRDAVQQGRLTEERLKSYIKLREELATQAALQREALLLQPNHQ